MKLLKFIVEAIFWIQIFLCPAGIIGFIGFVIYKNYPQVWGIVVFVGLLFGIALGIYFAERIRRTTGCSTFMARLFASPELDNKK